MAEKRSEKKLLALLVVLVAFSLVVNLLSLNVLYNIAEARQNGEGELAQLPFGYFYEDSYIKGDSSYDPIEAMDYSESSSEYFCSGDEVWQMAGSKSERVEDCGANDQECVEDGSGGAYCEN